MMKDPWYRQLANKGVVHWLKVIVSVGAGLYLGHAMSDARVWLEWRYGVSHVMQRLGHREPVVKHTTIVAVGSEDYWGSSLAARSPVNRAYLADLVGAIARGNPFLIALDFDMRSPQPDGSLVEIPEFEPETRRLIDQLRVVARDHHVVLPRTIWNGTKHGRYRLDSDVWNLTPELLEHPNVGSGYIALPPDLRQVPLAVHLENAPEPLDSFSLAIARARAEHVTDLLAQPGGREDLPFASFIPESDFPVHSAGEVMAADAGDLRKWFHGRLVLVGGEWSVLAAGRGGRVDSYLTPAGLMPGVFIHANFVEAFLDQRTFEPAPEWFIAALEIALVLACVVAFSLDLSNRAKMATCLLAFASLLFVNYVALQNLGRFFDFSIPLATLMLHISLDQIGEWRHHAREHRGCASHGAALVLVTLAAILASAPAASAQAPRVPQDGSEARPGETARPVDPMGPDPVVQDGVESADPAKPGGPKHDGDEIDRPIEAMGPGPVVGEEVESVDPQKPGGSRYGADPIDQELY